MLKRGSLELDIREGTRLFLEKAKNKEVLIISHFDTDGICSASIMINSLKKLDIKFSVKILKGLEEEEIKKLPKEKVIIFLDLASNSLNQIKENQLNNVFIIDHHEITQEIPEEINLINPEIYSGQKISGAGLTYLFCKELDETNKEFSKLAILGMIGDLMDKEIDKINSEIISEGEIKRKRGLLIYPSTRPINRTLEFSSQPYIPEVTGNSAGVLELLRECSLIPENGKYKSLIELNDEEMSKLITAIMLRNPQIKHEELIGDIFLLKHFNKLEDARELSAKINACSRMGDSTTALLFCMEIAKVKQKAENIHIKYKQNIIQGLNYIKEEERIQGKGFIIINAKNNIKDTIIGTIASILSNSKVYEEGTVVVTMAYREEKIKVSARNCGKCGRNVREILATVIQKLGEGEVGGHEHAAGCLITKEIEIPFINLLKENLEIQTIKI